MTLAAQDTRSIERRLTNLLFDVSARDVSRLRASGLTLAEATRRLALLQAELLALDVPKTGSRAPHAEPPPSAPPAPVPEAAAPDSDEADLEEPLTLVPEPSAPPEPIPEPEPARTPAPLAIQASAEWAVDEDDILETDDSIGPGGLSVEEALDEDAEPAQSDADLGPQASLGDLDASVGDNTVDRDLKAFFADESVEGSLADNALLRPGPNDPAASREGPAEGPRARRDKSLLTNVRKLFKK